MKSKMRYTALLAALIMALGLIAMPRAGAAGGNDDVELMLPPGAQFGDPDTGGQNRYNAFRWDSWIGAASRAVPQLRVSLVRQVRLNRAPGNIRARQLATTRR